MNNIQLYFISFHFTDCAVDMMMKIETFMQSNIKITLCC